ncbi:MAG: sporulation protein YabP [Clostridia bacterium]|nr:sporulation protein YabP [Clostridia bacterium]MDR3645009.1 sporulation protein YabP [Clostridia bacterium]
MAVVEEKKPLKKVHNLIIEDRRNVMVSGVTDVDSFDEQAVVLFTDLGELTIEGANLHMNKLNVETGEVSIEGGIDSISYRDEAPRGQGGGFLGRIFR